MNAAFLAFSVAPVQASRAAGEIDLLTLSLTVFSLLFTVAIVGLLCVFAVRYRLGSRADRTVGEEHATRQELVWIAIPAVIGLALFAWAAHIFLREGRPPADARTVYVVGRQWMWKIQHPEGVREINELHVPAGTPIKVVLSSQDVIHSFYVPAFRNKQDAVPGHFTTMWFEPQVPGVYHLFCAEYCGTEHSDMRGRVVVMPPQEFAQWLAAAAAVAPAEGTPGIGSTLSRPPTDLSARGAATFHRLGCASCHLPDAAVRAPRLDGLWGEPVKMNNGEQVIADEAYVRESILDPQARIAAGYPAPSLMPTYRGQVTDDDLVDLVEFIRSLRHGWPASETQETRP